MRNQPWRGPMTNGNGIANDVGNVQPSHNVGIGKDVKRKLSSNKDINGSLLASSLQRLRKMPNSWAQKDVVGSPDSLRVEKHLGRTGLGKEKQFPKPNRSEPIQSYSVKGRKGPQSQLPWLY